MAVHEFGGVQSSVTSRSITTRADVSADIFAAVAEAWILPRRLFFGSNFRWSLDPLRRVSVDFPWTASEVFWKTVTGTVDVASSAKRLAGGGLPRAFGDALKMISVAIRSCTDDEIAARREPLRELFLLVCFSMALTSMCAESGAGQGFQGILRNMDKIWLDV